MDGNIIVLSSSVLFPTWINIPNETYSKNEGVNCLTFSYILNTWNISGNINVLEELDGNFDFLHSIRIILNSFIKWLPISDAGCPNRRVDIRSQNYKIRKKEKFGNFRVGW